MREFQVMVVASAVCGLAWIGPVAADVAGLEPVSSFPLVTPCSGGLAVDATTVYVVQPRRPVMETYDAAGAFVTTVPLLGVDTLLGGYAGAALKDAGELYFTTMNSNDRESAVYTFTIGGAFISRTDFAPVVTNTQGITTDGAAAYVNQNDAPFQAYAVDPGTGAVLDALAAAPGHGQRLGLAWWSARGLLVETYDEGISLLDPADGSEVQHFGAAALGYDAQTFAAHVRDDRLYLMTLEAVHVYRFTPAACPADVDGSGAVDFADILALLAAWGPCAGWCPADLDGSGVVDFADALVALQAWGPCP